MTQQIQHDQLPKRQIYQFPVARIDGSKLTGAFMVDKVIRVEGVVLGSSIANCDSQLDTLKQALAAQEANLDIDYNGGTRRYVATAASVTISRPSAASFASFSIEFACSGAYGKDTSSSTLLSAATDTTASHSPAVTVGGSALFQRPVITALLNSGTGLTNKSITVINPATGAAITVTRTWVAADSLVIDTSLLTVKVNGAVVDYTGAFPTWAPGAGNIQRTDTLTTRSITLSATLVRQWQ